MPKAKISKQERYEAALKDHVKWMRSLGLKVSDNGHIIKSRKVAVPMSLGENFEKKTELSNVETTKPTSIGNGIKQDNSWKIEISKQYTIVPAYNKGPYMVVPKSDLKTAGRKV